MRDKQALKRVVQYVAAITVAGLVVAFVLRDLRLIVAESLVLASLLWMILKIKEGP